jgi:hypothetical protein
VCTQGRLQEKWYQYSPEFVPKSVVVRFRGALQFL